MEQRGADSQRFTESLPKRMKVLEETVKLEQNTASLLAQLFKVKSDNLSFGTTSKALGFDQKLNLLVDISMLDKEHRKRFALLQEMRNQFAHNFTTYTFEICLERTSFGVKKLLGWYPQDKTLPIEKQLEAAFDSMMFHTEMMIHEIVNKAMERWQDEYRMKVDSGGLSTFLGRRYPIFDVHRIAVNERLEKGETFTAEEVADMLRDILQKENDALNEGFQSAPTGSI